MCSSGILHTANAKIARDAYKNNMSYFSLLLLIYKGSHNDNHQELKVIYASPSFSRVYTRHRETFFSIIIINFTDFKFPSFLVVY